MLRLGDQLRLRRDGDYAAPKGTDMTVKGRRVTALLGGLLAGGGLGVIGRALLLDYANVVVAGGILFGLGLGILVAVSMQDRT